jgi:hypothetical protein
LCCTSAQTMLSSKQPCMPAVVPRTHTAPPTWLTFKQAGWQAGTDQQHRTALLGGERTVRRNRLPGRRAACGTDKQQCSAGAGSEEEQVRLFLQLWTLKEALVKARGTGINCPPGLAGFSIGACTHRPAAAME